MLKSRGVVSIVFVKQINLAITIQENYYGKNIIYPI